MADVEFKPDSYMDTVKERVRYLAEAPIRAGRRIMATAASTTPMDPKLRPGNSDETNKELDGKQTEGEAETLRRRREVAAELAGRQR